MARAVTRRVTAVEAFVEVEPVLSDHAAKAKAIAALTVRSEVAAGTTLLDTLKKDLMIYLAGPSKVIEEDDKGHRYMRFANAITTGGKQWRGIKREKRVKQQFDLDAAEAMLKEKDLYDEVAKTVTTIQLPLETIQNLRAEDYLTDEDMATVQSFTDFSQDDVYVLNQEKKITDAELDTLFDDTVTYAFVPFTEA